MANPLLPFGRFVVSQDELSPKHYWLTFITGRGYSTVLYDKSEKRLQAIGDHLNSVIAGETAPPKQSRR